MNWRTTASVMLMLSAGCASRAYYNVGSLDDQGRGTSEYCPEKIEPVGPSDPGKPAQMRSGDYIDYSGSCDGPTTREQMRKQSRFEQFRFGRDYIDD
jgi:hypothetical protein